MMKIIGVIFVFLVFTLVPSQQLELPSVRAATTAEKQPYNTLCDKHSRANLLAAYITPMLNSRKNKTQNYPTVIEAKLYMEANIYVIFTEDAIISSAKGLVYKTTLVKCETIEACWGRSLQVMNTTIQHFRKVAPVEAQIYENDLLLAQADVAALMVDIYRANTEFPTLALQASLNGSTYHLMFTAASYIAHGLTNMSSIYMKKMNDPIVLLCVDHQNNGTRSNLSQIIPPNTAAMYNSEVSHRAIHTESLSLYPELASNIGEYTNDAYNNMKASALLIEEQCLLPSTTTDFAECTKPARRDYASWGLQHPYRYGCTFDLHGLVHNIDTLHDQVVTKVAQSVVDITNFIENDIGQSFAHINSTATQIQDQLKASFDGDDCHKVARHAKNMYEALVPIVTTAHAELSACVANIHNDMNEQASIIMFDYHNAQSALQNKIEECHSDARGFDVCMNEFDITFPEQLPLVYAALENLSGGANFQSCKANADTTFNTTVQKLLNDFETDTGVKFVVT